MSDSKRKLSASSISIIKKPKSSSLSSFSSVITIVRDPEHVLGKQFTLSTDGSIHKQAAVSLSVGIAVMHHIDTHQALAELLTEVGNDPHAAIINAAFNGIEVGEEFLILSERQIEKRLGIPRDDRERQKGVHATEYQGVKHKAVGRFKENVLPSCWQYLDRDVDQHTPDEFASLSFDEWHHAVSRFLPGFDTVSYCRAASTSSRVHQDDKAVGGGNGHLWFRVHDPADIERFRTAVIVQAAAADMTWLKPRHSRVEPGKVIGHSLTTIVDPSVFTPGRLIFVGQPVVSEGLAVVPPSVTFHKEQQDSFDTAIIALPDDKATRSITRKAGVEMRVRPKAESLSIHSYDLTLNTEIETEDHATMTIREIVQSAIPGKIRCQTPFRESGSFAAFFNTGSDGTPFVHDVGTSITHWLSKSEQQELAFAHAIGVTAKVLQTVTDDCGAPFENSAIRAFALIREKNQAEYQRIRSELKKRNNSVSVVNLDRAVNKEKAAAHTPETHHGFALSLIDQLTVDGFPTVGHEGRIYNYDRDQGIWTGKPPEALVRMVAESHDGLSNCSRTTDYSGVALHAISLATDTDFFADAPVGLACPSGFYSIRGARVEVTPLSGDHRQRVKLKFDPKDQPTPLFAQFLHETFESVVEGEEDQQRALLQEIVGGIMLGILFRYQKAAIFYDPFGRAGKGTLERVVRELVPATFVTAISPFQWNREYYLASLAGARLNVVGELPDHESIPAAAFKSVTGGDLLTGRHPNHRTITFKNEAAHLFMTNHLINTRDHSEAFYARWLIIEFPNSRLRSGLPIDPSLANRIIESEMPGIAHWALQGALRLLEQRTFSQSTVHDRLMAKWRRTANSMEEFIYECCATGDDSYKVRRSHFYEQYRDWCTENGRKPFAKGKVKELLEHNIGLGIRLTSLDGYEIFRGVQINESNLEQQRRSCYPDYSPMKQSDGEDSEY